MNQSKKVSLIAIFAIMISTFSLMISYSAVTSMVDNRDNAQPVIKENIPVKPELIIKSVDNIFIVHEEDKFTMQPAIVNNKVKYGLNLNYELSTALFSVNLTNTGNKDATISEINIKGLEGLEKNVNVEIVGANIGDKIPAGSSINNIEISTRYLETIINEETLDTSLNIPLIEVEFVYE